MPLPGKLSADADVFESELTHVRGLVDVSKVGDLRRLQKLFDLFHVERTELVPFGDYDESIGSYTVALSSP